MLRELFVGEGLGSTSCVVGGGFSGGAGEGSDEGWKAVGVLVGQVFAFLLADVGVGEVDGVCFAASAHGDVDPFAVDAVAGDGVGTLGGGALGFVAGGGRIPSRGDRRRDTNAARLRIGFLGPGRW